MRILMISAEGPPLQRAGALIDVMDALPSALRARGHEVSVALPFYREIKKNRAFKKKDTGITVDVQVGDETHVARYLEGRSASGVQLFLIRCDRSEEHTSELQSRQYLVCRLLLEKKKQ